MEEEENGRERIIWKCKLQFLTVNTASRFRFSVYVGTRKRLLAIDQKIKRLKSEETKIQEALNELLPFFELHTLSHNSQTFELHVSLDI